MRKYKGAGIALFKKQNNDYAILLGKRTIKPNKGKWSIPGGGFEQSDNSLFVTAIRELREETGIDLSLTEQDAVICSFHYPFFEWKTFMFEVDSDFHVPERFCYEFSEIKFISLKDIHQYKLAFGVRKEINHFKKRYQKKQSAQVHISFMHLSRIADYFHAGPSVMHWK